MGEPQTPHFCDFGLGAPKTPKQNQEKTLVYFKTSYFINLEISETPAFVNSRNRDLKTLDMRSISIENMKWTFANM